GDRDVVVVLRRTEVEPRLGVDVIRAEPPLALAAIDHRVREPLEVAARLPHAGMHQHRGLEPEDVPAEGDRVAPPEVPDVALELDAERAIVPGGAEAAVDLARLEDEAPALAEADEGVHVDHAKEPTTAFASARASRRSRGRH